MDNLLKLRPVSADKRLERLAINAFSLTLWYFYRFISDFPLKFYQNLLHNLTRGAYADKLRRKQMKWGRAGGAARGAPL